MRNIVVVNNPRNWPLEIPEVEVVPARTYISDPAWSKVRRVRVFNMCRSYRYQSSGYYVSLLAEARGHRPLPSVMTMQDLKLPAVVRLVSDEMNALIQKSLKPILSDQFTLSVYFGRNVAERYRRISQQLFAQFQSPFIRAQFVRLRETWILQSVVPIAANQIPESHHPFVIEFAREYFMRRKPAALKKNETRFDLAILHNPEEKFPPSDEKALQKFVRAAEGLGFYTELIGREDYSRLAEFDALFIRETTGVNHHTWRFARRAAAEGLVVIDDPESILKCTNKVYLAELLLRNGIPTPATLILSEDQADRPGREIGFPCIVKQPDSSFSQGVVKADSEAELQTILGQLFGKSDLLIVQEFLPTEFDWRVGILNGKVLFVCRYHMARKHWQIYERDGSGRVHSGRVDTVPVEEVPEKVVEVAVRAAGLIGDGLYGVDLKEAGGQVRVIEINDNPSIESGCEDELLRDQLYRQVMEEILRRVELKKGGTWPTNGK